MTRFVSKSFLTNVAVLIALAWGMPKMVLADPGRIHHVFSPQGLAKALSTIKEDQRLGRDISSDLVVAQGAVVKHLSALPTVPAPRAQVSELQEQGVGFEVCTYAVLDQKLSLNQLLKGVRHLDGGAPARLKELRRAGYEYRRY